ncbi:hypothetical protein ACQ4PT_038413 [Festuca glaucescens]
MRRLLHGAALSLLLLAAVAHAQQTARTHPGDAAALKEVFAKLRLPLSAWDMSFDPCTGQATDNTGIDNNPLLNPGIKCELCTGTGNTSVCRITRLELGQNYLTGPLSSLIGELTAMQYMSLGINALSGPLPKELGNLTNLIALSISSNNFSGSLPPELGNLAKLEQLYIDSAGFTGPLPSSLSKLTNMRTLWASDNDFTGLIPDYIGSWTNLTELVLRNCRISDKLVSIDFSNFTSLGLLDLSFNNITGQVPQTLFNLSSLSFLNLVSNNFTVDSSSNSVLPMGWMCLQHDTPCFLGSPESSSFAVDSGSVRSISGSDGPMYEPDDASLGPASYYVAASYYVTGAPTWGVSNVGRFMDASNGSYIIYSSQQFQNTLDSELFLNARMSPSSLRYFGIGLENGNYTVTLQFAEFDFPDAESWKSRGRRVFDIYVQGERKEQNFDIKKAAGGKSYTAVRKQYTVPVTKNFLEIHLFWAGKGTCCIPNQGYYGPTISALSATPSTPLNLK